MKEDISYYIPVKSHVKKYLASAVAVDPFKVTVNNEFGTLLYLGLSHKSWPPNQDIRLDFNDRMLIEISKWNYQVFGPFISNKKIELFNKTIEKLMYKELFIMLDHSDQQYNYIQSGIIKFRNKYNITDEEMDYHRLRKAYQRKRENSKVF